MKYLALVLVLLAGCAECKKPTCSKCTTRPTTQPTTQAAEILPPGPLPMGAYYLGHPRCVPKGGQRV